MNLCIRESNYLFEDIAAVRKYYPNIPDDIFMQLIALDPTYRNNNSLGKYGKWILNLYNKGNLSEDEFEEVTPLLQQFTTYRNRVANKDLNAYKSLQELSDILASVIDDDSMLTDRQKLRFKKNVKAGRISTAAEDDYDIVLDTPKYTVYVPNTHEASMKLGKGTGWCTAHENPDWYNSYTENDWKLYIIRDKSAGKRWQYSDKNGDFLDEDDEPFDVAKLMKSDKALSKFFEKFLGIDYYSFDGIWVYDGDEIPEKFKSIITKIVINDDVFEIKDNAFSQCHNLVSIDIPDSIEYIGECAFNRCNCLESVVIPEGVESIEYGTFFECYNLKYIKLPESLTYIGSDTFYGCTSLTTIKIPDSVSVIGYDAFNGCDNLKSINFPKSAEEVNDRTFDGCQSLKEIDISSASHIGSKAFCDCISLEYVKLSDHLDEIQNDAFYGCESLRELIIKTDPYVGDSAFVMCDNLTIYTDSEAIRDEWASDVKAVKPLSAKNESFNRLLKLKIKEDTCCVTSKTAYIEDGFDKNGIYYFGKKPKTPMNWKDFLQNKGRRKDMKIKESYYDLEDNVYEMLKTKEVPDFDGFSTEYTLYSTVQSGEPYYVCVLGDRDLYDPNDGVVDFDFETDSYAEAMEWFDSYSGGIESDDGLDESLDIDEELIFDSSNQNLMDQYGGFMQMDSVIDGFVNNLSDEDIDETLKLYKRIAKFLGVGDRYSDISCYMCVADWLDPIDHKTLFDNFRRIYKNKDIDAYYGEFRGNKFAVDRLGTYGSFNIYALDEDTITDILETINEEYE